MSNPVRIAVIDIGKTNAKVVLFDLERQTETAVETRPNVSVRWGSYAAFDTQTLWAFIKTAIARLHSAHGIDAISITTHGACFALLDEFGDLALPVIDYEDASIAQTATEYEAIRPSFDETGSPRLPVGLNAGAQIFHLQKTYPEAFAKVRWIVPYPQFWTHLLTGKIVSEVTSLGVHTDLWNPHQGIYSSLVDLCGWTTLMPEIHKAESVTGVVLPALAAEMGLPQDMPVYCGIHDSNASLLPHLLSRTAPFSVVSTGTWVVSMAVGGEMTDLDERRDTLINVNAWGQSVPSARFMGGRAFELLTDDPKAIVTAEDRDRVLKEQIMFLPSLPADSGPFPGTTGRWTVDSTTLTAGMRLFAVSLYLALMTKVTLDLIGAKGELILEGPFSRNAFYREMLSNLTGHMPVSSESGITGTSFGAACMALEGRPLRVKTESITQFPADQRLQDYAENWGATVAEILQTQNPFAARKSGASA